MKEFPKVERRAYCDLYPGMMFYFVNPPENRGTITWCDIHGFEWDKDCIWTLVTKGQIPEGTWKGTNRYLLGNDTLKWYEGNLGWIRRVTDPVWEAREDSD